ncbi:uncharacterized protein B0H64DRAFT_380355 [Chaetomium fimeti]|uniref:Uncharacterized protein n=1 Tax=Chaetomium fimeti TaxID=1854472 RepID=A0AAE0HPX2_9PEZI|nr:hypothetical protein B0H64DRAFT_380355 [Chaetomium fimeti]
MAQGGLGQAMEYKHTQHSRHPQPRNHGAGWSCLFPVDSGKPLRLIRILRGTWYRNVTRGALVLRFNLLFLRAPGPGEGCFVSDVPDLENYAKLVWGWESEK